MCLIAAGYEKSTHKTFNETNSLVFPVCDHNDLGKTVWMRYLPSPIANIDFWSSTPIFRRDQFIFGDNPIGCLLEHGHMFS